VVLVVDEAEPTVQTAGALIYLGTVLSDGVRHADVVLPIANVVEEDGTFVNRDGRVQRYFQARPAPGWHAPRGGCSQNCSAALGRGTPLTDPAEAFDRLTRSVGPFAGLSYASLGMLGKHVGAAVEATA